MLDRRLVPLLAILAAMQAKAAVDLQVAPDGHGASCTRASPCALATAQARVRQGGGRDFVVELHSGTYRLAATWTLDARDGGRNGHRATYQALGFGGASPATVIISGGMRIGGPWKLAGKTATGLQIHRADVPATLETRQLYVNGRRAERAVSTAIPADLARTPTGYTTHDAGFARWGNPADAEFVFTGGDYGRYDYAAPQPFTAASCPLDRIARAGDQTRIALNPICNDIAAKWGGSRWYADGAYRDFGRPSRVENAYELLALPGQWYLDRTGAVAGDGKRAIYYVPRAGEDMARAQVIAPVLETLVEGHGAANLTFRGLTFAYATWNEPSRRGIIVEQANMTVLAHPGVGQPMRTGYVHGNVRFAGARGLVFEGDRFEHLGGDALVLDGGAKGNRVQGNAFTDISGAGIRLGDYADPQAPPAGRESDNLIADNVLHDLPREYRGGNAIFTGYTERTTVEHNTVYNAPYTAVSAGYGFGMPNYQSGFHFVGNHLYNFGQIVMDGGGVYVNSRQGTSYASGAAIDENYIHNQGNSYNAVYTDESARYISIRHNALHNNFHDFGGCRPLGNLVFTDNYWQTGRSQLGCRPFIPEPVTIERNTLIDRGRVDCERLAGCAAIMATAGVRARWSAIEGRGWVGASFPASAWRRDGADRLLGFTGTRARLFGSGAGTVAICDAQGRACEPETAFDGAAGVSGTGLLWASVPRPFGHYTLRLRGSAQPTSTDILSEPRSVDDVDGIAYKGAWISRGDDTNDNPRDSTYNASFSAADAPGAVATLVFIGTGARLYGLKHPAHGIGAVSIDGGPPTDVDFYGFERLGDQALWESPELPRGRHTLTLAWTGRRSALAQGTHIALDRVEVFP